MSTSLGYMLVLKGSAIGLRVFGCSLHPGNWLCRVCCKSFRVNRVYSFFKKSPRNQMVTRAFLFHREYKCTQFVATPNGGCTAKSCVMVSLML